MMQVMKAAFQAERLLSRGSQEPHLHRNQFIWFRFYLSLAKSYGRHPI